MAEHKSKDTKEARENKSSLKRTKAEPLFLDSPIKPKMGTEACLESILQRLKALHDLAQGTKSTTDATRQDLQELRKDVFSISNRLTEAETRISKLEDLGSDSKQPQWPYPAE